MSGIVRRCLHALHRGYAAARWGAAAFRTMRVSSGSANAELFYDSATLRDRSRQLFRDNAEVRAAIEGLVAHIASTGIDVEPATGNAEHDTAIKAQWLDWCEHASACGQLSLWELQRQAIRAWGTSGEVLWRFVIVPDDRRPIPLAIQPFECDQLADSPVAPIAAGARFHRGIEVDGYGRRIAYHLLTEHPGDTARLPGLPAPSGDPVGVRIPAGEMLHIYEVLRPGQLRGEPVLAPVMGVIHQAQELVSAELRSAIAGAAPAGAITGKQGTGGLLGQSTNGTAAAAADTRPREVTISPGQFFALDEGEDIKIIQSNRPSQLISPFRLMLRGDFAGALRIRRTDLDKDYSQANYSSMRAAQLDLMRHIVPLQHLFGKSIASAVYLCALPMLRIAAGVPAPRHTAAARIASRHNLLPDGFPYVDPEKDIRAAVAAIAGGLSCHTDEIGAKGKDVRGLWGKIVNERKLLKFLGLSFDLSGTNAPAPDSTIGVEETPPPKPKQDAA